MSVLFQRDIFIDKIYEHALTDKDIFFISADFGAPSLDKFRENLPNQFIHAGISEQNMIDTAAGLSLAGKKVYVYAMAPFITLRCLEQIKCSLAMMNLPVTILAVGVGLGYADAGPTHYCNEDVACMRSIVGLDVCSASDAFTTEHLAKLTLKEPKLRVVRMERHALKSIYSKDEKFDNSGFKAIVEGEKTCVLSYGHMLHRANEAVKNLSSLNVKPTLIDVFIFKPLSHKLIESIKDYQNILTIEEQCLDGGFGSIIIESLSDIGFKNNIKRIGLPNKYFFENGGRDYLLDNNGLSVLNIENEIKKFNN